MDEALHLARIDSPWGAMHGAVDRAGRVVRLDFPHPAGRERLAGELAAAGARIAPGAAPAARLARQLAEYFAGERRVFDLPLAPRGTSFQIRVWEVLRGIPYAETRGYGELARELGRPGAARAVGSANGANPIPVIVPCHRVVGADGSLTGFGGGLAVKADLLALERRVAGLALF